MTDLFTSKSDPPFIDRIEIYDLFGFKNYVLDVGNRTTNNLAFLYGDNGSGKSTILNLIYSLLSKNVNEGNRGYLANTPFRELFVRLHDGTTIQLTKGEGLTGGYSVWVKGRENFEIDIVVSKEMTVLDSENKTIKTLNQFLANLQIEFVYITDDRRIKTTIPILRRILKLEEEETPGDTESLWRRIAGYRPLSRDTKARIDIEAITDALRDWIHSKAFQDTTFGQHTADNIYLELAQQIASPQLFDITKGIRRETLVGKIDALEKSFRRPIKYRLMPVIKFEEFRNAVSMCGDEQLDILFAIIGPYLDTLTARNIAIAPVTEIIDNLLNELTGYLVDKELIYTIQEGLALRGWQQKKLDFPSLSSGERQLIFLFCSSILAREGRCIFLIDEPELSLNVKWQRMLFKSLSELVKGSNTNFLSATHSLEILTQHENSILTLGK
jgi:energy-coupling factor transporter ATP-binding protein EcfA2